MMLTCERAREVLWPPDRPRSHSPEEEHAQRHLATCEACRIFFLRDAELADLLRRIGEGLEVPAPTGLRAAVAEALAAISVEEHRPGHWKRAGLRAEITAAAAAVILLGGGLVLADQYEGEGDPDRFAADYVRTAVVQVERPGLEISAVEAFYEEALGRRVVPVALHDAPVTRATVCDLAGDLGSMIEYDLAGMRLVHYRIPRNGDPDPGRMTDVTVDSRRGVQVAHWVDGEFENALVSEAAADYVRWLAERRFTLPAGVTNYGSPASRAWRQASN